MFIMLIFFVNLIAGGAHAQMDFKFGVYVQDEASLLQPKTQEILYSKAVWLHDKTGASAQVSVVTIKSLGNQTLEDLAVSRFREMGLEPPPI